jgi:PleD family two-component response regulator
MGIASWPESHASVLTELLLASDQALYRAKAGGRNRAEV